MKKLAYAFLIFLIIQYAIQSEYVKDEFKPKIQFNKDDTISLEINRNSRILDETQDIDKQVYIAYTEKDIIVDTLVSSFFTGDWKSDYKIYNLNGKTGGMAHVEFERARQIETNLQALAMKYKIYEGEFNDHWLMATSYITNEQLFHLDQYKQNQSDIANTTDQDNALNGSDTSTNNNTNTVNNNIANNNTVINNNNNSDESLVLSGNFHIKYEKGEIFSIKDYSKSMCNGNITLSFQPLRRTLKIYQNKTLLHEFEITIANVSQFNASIQTNCGFSMDLMMHQNDSLEITFKKSLSKYSIIVSTISILAAIGTGLVIFHSGRHDQDIEAISLSTIGEGFLWHSYCCLSHFWLGVKFPTYFLKFAFLGLIYLINSFALDMRIMYSFWQIYHRDSAPEDRILNFRKKLRFYILLYFIFFISIFFVLDLYYEKFGIYLILCFSWAPQIISNIIYNNRKGLPFFYLLFTTLDKIIFPIYYRSSLNPYYIRNDEFLIFILCLMNILGISILIIQNKLGPRFFLPLKYQKGSTDLYKNKEEIVSILGPAILANECVICLSPLEDALEEENNFENINKIDNNNDNITNTSIPKVIGGHATDNKIELEDSTDREMNTSTTQVNLSHNERFTSIDKNNNKFSTKCDEFKKRLAEELTPSNIKERIKQFGKFLFHIQREQLNPLNKKYMLTPCNHVFHAQCLDTWFDTKKVCPNCRAVVHN